MSRARWHILRTQRDARRVVTVARHLPAQFDVEGQGSLPSGNPVALGQQIRQDLWRMLQRERGFSPVVELTEMTGGGWSVRAGGRLAARPAPGLQDRISALLNDPQRRARWISQARRRQIPQKTYFFAKAQFDKDRAGGQ